MIVRACLLAAGSYPVCVIRLKTGFFLYVRVSPAGWIGTMTVLK